MYVYMIHDLTLQNYNSVYDKTLNVQVHIRVKQTIFNFHLSQPIILFFCYRYLKKIYISIYIQALVIKCIPLTQINYLYFLITANIFNKSIDSF